jgi:hypothetical protein
MIDQMVIKYTKIFRNKTLQKFTQIGIFGLKTNHLATLRPQHFDSLTQKDDND